MDPYCTAGKHDPVTSVPAPEPPDPGLLTAYLDAPYDELAQRIRADLPQTAELLKRQPTSRATRTKSWCSKRCTH